MSRIAVVDYGMGNLRSVAKALEHVAPTSQVLVTADPEVILSADRVVFPGQGAAPDCMREIRARGLQKVIEQAARTKPFLGICMGLQVLFEFSEEGNTHCLGVLPGKVLLFPREAMYDAGGQRLKVPHMGWNEVQQTGEHPMWAGIPDASRFYFVHSYYVEAGHPDMVAAFTLYPFPFTSAVAAGKHIFAVQFHPEKSQSAGLRLLANFATWDGTATS